MNLSGSICVICGLYGWFRVRHRVATPGQVGGLCAVVVQTAPKLVVSATLFRRVGLKPLTEEAEHSRYQVEGDDDEHDDQQAPRHRQIVAGEW